MSRKPNDGKPYYCVLCGAGFGEFMACEMPDCELEDEARAASREQLVYGDDYYLKGFYTKPKETP